MMHGHEKSRSAIVAVKPTNKAERSAAEPVEPRAETKGNAGLKTPVSIAAAMPQRRGDGPHASPSSPVRAASCSTKTYSAHCRTHELFLRHGADATPNALTRRSGAHGLPCATDERAPDFHRHGRTVIAASSHRATRLINIRGNLMSIPINLEHL
jgi:hypothetical protein